MSLYKKKWKDKGKKEKKKKAQLYYFFLYPPSDCSKQFFGSPILYKMGKDYIHDQGFFGVGVPINYNTKST